MKTIYFLACLLPALNLAGYGQRLTYNMDRNWKFYVGDTTHADEPGAGAVICRPGSDGTEAGHVLK